MLDLNMGGVIKAAPHKLGLRDSEKFKVDRNGYLTYVRCEVISGVVDAYIFKKNTWYLLSPNLSGGFPHKVSAIVSPTEELITYGLTRHVSCPATPSDIKIWWRPQVNIAVEDITYHLQILLIEGVE